MVDDERSRRADPFSAERLLEGRVPKRVAHEAHLTAVTIAVAELAAVAEIPDAAALGGEEATTPPEVANLGRALVR
jgi:hypothetical protein